MKVIIVTGSPSKEDFTAGISSRFLQKEMIILDSLIGKLGFSKKDIFTFMPDGSPGSAEKLKKDLEEIFLEYSEEDVCLFYAGHGQENGWGMSGKKDMEEMTYEQLGRILACHFGNLIFVNYCCFSGAARYALLHHIGEFLLIAAMPEDRSDAADKFCRYVMEHWENRRFFNPHLSRESTLYIPPVEGNEALQTLIFSNNRSVK